MKRVLKNLEMQAVMMRKVVKKKGTEKMIKSKYLEYLVKDLL
jgi:hypothetical protein